MASFSVRLISVRQVRRNSRENANCICSSTVAHLSSILYAASTRTTSQRSWQQPTQQPKPTDWQDPPKRGDYVVSVLIEPVERKALYQLHSMVMQELQSAHNKEWAANGTSSAIPSQEAPTKELSSAIIRETSKDQYLGILRYEFPYQSKKEVERVRAKIEKLCTSFIKKNLPHSTIQVVVVPSPQLSRKVEKPA